MISAGDTAWLLISAALVLLMVPGVGFFYGGMVRRKNIAATMMQCFIVIAIISIQWVLWGYSLAFGPDKGGFIGGLEWVGLRNVGFEPNPAYAAMVPHEAFMIFQGMFAIITPALIIGAFAERIKFKAFLIFVVLWSTIVYDPLAHWVWGNGGWLRDLGFLDFAGGAVVHISSGTASLAAALVMKKRLGFGREPMEPSNVPFVILGAGLLWFGWFGFNAGSALSSGGLAANAFVVTNTAGAMGALTWMTMSWMFGGKPSIIGAVSGGVVGLAAVTPAAGFITPMAAVIIGMGAGIFCYLAVRLRNKANLDDSLDVWGCHGVGGIWGVLAAGLFATAAINGVDGLFYGHPGQLWIQFVGVAVTWVWSFVMTVILIKIIDRFIGMNVAENDERTGLDVSQHGERAYEA